ncbi:hypothetical protein FO519_009620, partial [Halicephalobus sp. NKZ332]
MTYNNNSDMYQMLPQKTSPVTWPLATSILGACVTVTCIGCFFCNAYWIVGHADLETLEIILYYQFIIADLGGLLPAWALFLMNFNLKKVILGMMSKKLREFMK